MTDVRNDLNSRDEELAAAIEAWVIGPGRSDAAVPVSPPAPASTAGPSTADPSTADPSTADPSTAGPSTADPSTADPSTAEWAPVEEDAPPVPDEVAPATDWYAELRHVGEARPPVMAAEEETSTDVFAGFEGVSLPPETWHRGDDDVIPAAHRTTGSRPRRQWRGRLTVKLGRS